MNQDDIYNLLLIVLLMSNEHGNLDEQTVSTRSSLNELIITSLLLNSCSDSSTDSCGCRSRNRNSNTNTTF